MFNVSTWRTLRNAGVKRLMFWLTSRRPPCDARRGSDPEGGCALLPPHRGPDHLEALGLPRRLAQRRHVRKIPEGRKVEPCDRHIEIGSQILAQVIGAGHLSNH